MHEAKTHLSRLVEEAVAGMPFLICKAGRPMVRVSPLDGGDSPAAPQRLPAGVAPMFEDPEQVPVFSVQPAVLRRALLDGGWQELPIEAHHALAVAALPPLHRVRSTVCCSPRANAEGLLLITADQQLVAYPVPVRLMHPRG